jgi:hypothetical protein
MRKFTVAIHHGHDVYCMTDALVKLNFILPPCEVAAGLLDRFFSGGQRAVRAKQ